MLLCATLLGVAACATGTKSARLATSARADGAESVVVARVDDVGIDSRQLAPYLRANRQVQIPGRGLPKEDDVRRDAVQSAIRAQLFLLEAKRRGLSARTVGSEPLVQAQLVQALLRQEVEHHLTAPEQISSSEVRRYFEAHRRDLFAEVLLVDLAAIVLQPNAEASADDLLVQAKTADSEAFATMVAQYSVDEASKRHAGAFATLDMSDHASGADPAIAQVAAQMREAGDVGLARGADERWYVLRATKVHLNVPSADVQIDESVDAWLRNLIYAEKNQQFLADFAARLAAQHAISVDEVALRQVAVPVRDGTHGDNKPIPVRDGTSQR